jgi:hypothetical protein
MTYTLINRHGLVPVLLSLVALAGCEPRARNSPEAAAFYSMIIEFVDAAAQHDTATLRAISYDERALQDAEILRENAPRILRSPSVRLSRPHHVTIKGDTAAVFLIAREDGREEFGTEFRRVGAEWHIVRIGLSPR